MARERAELAATLVTINPTGTNLRLKPDLSEVVPQLIKQSPPSTKPEAAGCLASNSKITDELEWTWKETSMVQSKYYPGICFEGEEKPKSV